MSTLGTVFVAVVPSTLGFGAAAKAQIESQIPGLVSGVHGSMRSESRKVASSRGAILDDLFMGGTDKQAATRTASRAKRNVRTTAKGMRDAATSEALRYGSALEYAAGTRGRGAKQLERNIKRTAKKVPQTFTDALSSGGGGGKPPVTALGGGMSDDAKGRAAADAITGGEKVVRKNLGRQLSNAGRRTTLSPLGLGSIAGLYFSTKFAAQFESAIQRAGSVMGDVTYENQERMESLRQAAMDVAKDYPLTNIDAANALGELAKSGLSYQKSLAALRPATEIAVAGQIDLADAAKYVAATVNTFGVQGSDAIGSVGDAFVKAANVSNAEIGDIALAMTYAGSYAKGFGLSVEEASAALALLGKNGIVGSKAGTQLRSVLGSLARPTSLAKEAMRKYNLEFTTADGKFKSLAGVAKELNRELGGLSQVERENVLGTLFGKYGGNLSRYLTKDPQKFINLLEQIEGASGEAAKQASRALSPLEKAFVELKGSVENFAVSLGNAMTPGLLLAAGALDSMAEAAADLPTAALWGIAGALTAAAVAGPLLWAAGGTIAALTAIKGVFAAGAGGAAAGGLSRQVAAAAAGSELAATEVAAVGTAAASASKWVQALRVGIAGIVVPAGWALFTTGIDAITGKASEILGFADAFSAIGRTIKTLTPGVGALTVLGEDIGGLLDQIGGIRTLGQLLPDFLPGAQSIAELRAAKVSETINGIASQIKGAADTASANSAIGDARNTALSAVAMSDYVQALGRGLPLMRQRNSVMAAGARTTAAESQNLRQVAATGREVLRSQIAQGRSATELTAGARQIRQAFIQQAMAMGRSRQEAQVLARAYGVIPKSIVTEIKTKGEAPVKQKIKEIDNTLAKIRKAKTEVKVSGRSPEEKRRQLERLNDAADKLKKKKSELKIGIKGDGKVLDKLNQIKGKVSKKERMQIIAQAKIDKADNDIDKLLKKADEVESSDPKVEASTNADVIAEQINTALGALGPYEAYVNIIATGRTDLLSGVGGTVSVPDRSAGGAEAEAGAASAGLRAASVSAASRGGKGGGFNLGSMSGILKYIEALSNVLQKRGVAYIQSGLSAIVDAFRAGDWGEKARKEFDKNFAKLREAAQKRLDSLREIFRQFNGDVSQGQRGWQLRFVREFTGEDAEAALKGIQDTFYLAKRTDDLTKKQKKAMRKAIRRRAGEWRGLTDVLKRTDQAKELQAALEESSLSVADYGSRKTATGLASYLGRQASKMQELTGIVSELRGLGYSPEVLQRLLQLDPITALPLARSLKTASRETRLAINASQASLVSSAEKLGKAGAQAAFGIDPFQNFADGLQAEEQAVERSLAGIIRRIRKKWGKALGITVTFKESRVERDLARVAERQKRDQKNSRPRGGNRATSAAGGGDVINVTVNGQPSESDRQLARRVARETAYRVRKKGRR